MIICNRLKATEMNVEYLMQITLSSFPLPFGCEIYFDFQRDCLRLSFFIFCSPPHLPPRLTGRLKSVNLMPNISVRQD